MYNTAQEIIDYIRDAKKTTTVKMYVNGTQLPKSDLFHCFGNEDSRVLIGDIKDIEHYIETNKDNIEDYYLEQGARNSAVPLLDITHLDARIEPGCIIRDYVSIGKNVAIMMGAMINIGVKIGDETMIDMGVVLGGRVEVGKRCHIGAGSVLAGVIEPPSAKPVVVEDDVLIGANAVVVEGVHIGKGAVVGAGSIVLNDVPENAVVVGNPARIIKMEKSQETKEKTQIIQDLRKI